MCAVYIHNTHVHCALSFYLREVFEENTYTNSQKLVTACGWQTLLPDLGSEKPVVDHIATGGLFKALKMSFKSLQSDEELKLEPQPPEA